MRSMGVGHFPLREKRKAQTRRALIRSARQLFSQQGYEQTTLEAIADHAGLHVQTLYRHFSNKQELATAGDQDLLDRFREGIQDQERTDSTFQFWRGWVAEAMARVTQDGGRAYRQFQLQRWSQSVVSSRLMAIGHQYEDLLTESLARDFEMPADTAGQPRLVAIMLWGGNSHVLRRHATLEQVDLAGEALAVIDAVERLFGHLVRDK